MFQGRSLLIATKHKKEQVIAPILSEHLEVTSIVSNFDTDIFGTFTGEVERINDPLTTVRNKCLKAMELHEYDLGVASEGSFGPHPSLYFMNADEEWLILIDKKNDLEIIVREISMETNFNGRQVNHKEQLYEFAKQQGFPSHGLILRDQKCSNEKVIKDIRSFKKLSKCFEEIISSYGSAYVETDMRASYNPTRMNVIHKAALKLVEKMKSCCPSCGTPGFDIVQAIDGLPCELCSTPTRSIKSVIYGCKKCNYSDEHHFPDKKEYEKPLFCDYCNP